MQKPICLITGATDGVGRATAAELARKGFTVVLAARNAAKAEAVKAEIAAATGNHDLDIVIGDLASLTQVRQLAEAFKLKYPRLDVLINNAGIFVPARNVTEDGLETTFQVNYLSAFLLTQLLLAELEKSEQGRIINLSSSIYTLGKFDPRNLQGEEHFSGIGAYSASKLFMLLFSIEHARRLRGSPITANAVHPGVVRTPMLATASGLFRIIAYLALPFAISPQKGAATSVHLASSPEAAAASGLYFANRRPLKVKSKFNTDEARNQLWQLSVESLQKRGLLNV